MATALAPIGEPLRREVLAADCMQTDDTSVTHTPIGLPTWSILTSRDGQSSVSVNTSGYKGSRIDGGEHDARGAEP